ncbi:MAG: hypothetical protein WBQ73_02565 [Candidatus Babeliales bacterium]
MKQYKTILTLALLSACCLSQDIFSYRGHYHGHSGFGTGFGVGIGTGLITSAALSRGSRGSRSDDRRYIRELEDENSQLRSTLRDCQDEVKRLSNIIDELKNTTKDMINEK